MKSFLARLVFQVQWEPQHAQPLFEEQLRLFIAIDKLDAFTQANAIGHTEEGNFPFYRGGSVNWVFEGLTSLDEIDQIHSGLLLDSSQRNSNSFAEENKFIQSQIRRFKSQLEVEMMSNQRIV